MLKQKSHRQYLAKNLYADNSAYANGNTLLLGAPGSGKTTNYIIPSILNDSTTDTSLVISDCKQSLYKMLKTHLEVKGYKVVLIDFKNPEQSNSYNPLDFIQRNTTLKTENGKKIKETHYREQDYMVLANLLISENLESEDKFWLESSRYVLVSLMSYCAEMLKPEDLHFGSVAEVFRIMNGQVNEFQKGHISDISIFSELKAISPDSFALKKYEQFKNIFDSERTYGCISMFLADCLDFFDHSECANMFCKESSIRLSDIGKEKTALFVNVDDTSKSMEKMQSILFTQLFQSLVREADKTVNGVLPNKVHFLLDDFCSSHIEDFDVMINTMRSRGISCSIALQSMTQLESKYNRAEAINIMDAMDTMLFYGCNDIATAQAVSIRANRPIEDILNLPLNKLYIFQRGHQPIQTNKLGPNEIDEMIKNIQVENNYRNKNKEPEL